MDSQNQNIIRQVMKGWNIAVVNRYELLESLRDDDLDFVVSGKDKHEDLQSQFATIGGTYQAYIQLLKTRKFDSSIFSPLEKNLTTMRKIDDLEKTLKKIDAGFETEVYAHSDNEEFDWGAVKTPIWRAIITAQEMERLCHGQMVCYFALLGLSLPPNFKKQWGLEKPLVIKISR